MLEGKIVATSLKAWRTLVPGCKEENKEVRYDPLCWVHSPAPWWLLLAQGDPRQLGDTTMKFQQCQPVLH